MVAAEVEEMIIGHNGSGRNRKLLVIRGWTDKIMPLRVSLLIPGGVKLIQKYSYLCGKKLLAWRAAAEG